MELLLLLLLLLLLELSSIVELPFVVCESLFLELLFVLSCDVVDCLSFPFLDFSPERDNAKEKKTIMILQSK